MLYSSTAEAKGINNKTTDPVIIENLRALCTYVLQPTRDNFGPLTVSSGYSCLALATVLGRKRNIDFDQLIYERRYRRGTKQVYDWVHISYKKDGKNRNQVLHSPVQGGYLCGLPKA